VHVKEPGFDLTSYVVGVPPAPEDTVTTAEASPTTADGANGTPGTAGCGLTEFELNDEAEVSEPSLALAVNVYDVPFDKPVTVQAPAAPVTVHMKAPGEDVTRYEVGALPKPEDTVTTAEASPAIADGIGGVPNGIVDGTEATTKFID
jgi:hypothetical protein